MRRWLMLIVTIVLVLVIDQVSKRAIMDTMTLGESRQPIPALAPFFQITYTWNEGAAFGFLTSAGGLFLVIAFVVSAVMIWYYPRMPAEARASRVAVGFVIGGALGNALDRLNVGAVIDFIHYQIPGVISNVSNLADHAIVFGVIVIVIESWRLDLQKKRSVQLGQSE
jgi:signal peptidase II